MPTHQTKLPYSLQKRGSLLLHQQCWLWGQDVRRPEGNLLLQEGFQRTRAPEGVTGCSQYHLHLSGALHVRLWGFGLYYGAQQGIYLNRYAFAPLRVAPTSAVWTAQAFHSLTPSQDFRKLAEAVQWIVSFESSLQQTTGLAYRNRCLLGWNKRALAPGEFLDAWKHLAEDLARFADRYVAAAHPGVAAVRLRPVCP